MIELRDIRKTFKVSKRNAGFGEAMKAMFKREYTYVHALDGISFTINDGEMVGYIGPNGAGKSSTIKVMSGVLTPDGGTCRINNRTPWQDRINHVREIGVVFGQRSQLWWDVPVIDSFELIRDIYKVDNNEYKQSLDMLVSMLDIAETVRTPARQLSLGQRMRCEIAASLLHNPRILFLDEPTIGLDAVSKIAVRHFIRKLNAERKTTVILTTHDMQDIEALTERILLIGKGKILLDGSLSELKRRNAERQHGSRRTLMVDFTEGSVVDGSVDIPLTPGLSIAKRMEGRIEFSVDTEHLSVSDAIAFLSNHLDLMDVSVIPPSVEEMVVSLYKEYEL